MKFFIACMIVSFILYIIIRFIMRAKIASNVWKNNPPKTFIDRWFLWNVHHYVPTSILIFLTLLPLVVIGLSVAYAVYDAQNARKILSSLQTIGFFVTAFSLGMVEIVRHK